MVRVPSFAATEEALAVAAARPDSPAGGPQEAVKDPQPPPTSAATATSDADASDTEVSARKTIAQAPLADTGTVDEMGMGETHVDASDPLVNPITDDGESPTQPNEPASPWSVEDNLSDKPRVTATDNLDVPLGGEAMDEEEFSMADDGNESHAPSTQPAAEAATDEPIATAQPITKEPAQASNAEAADSPTPSPMAMGVEEVITTPRTITPAPVTTKPLLRTDTANAVISNSSTLHSRLNQGNPLLLLSFAVICCGFLVLWVRKRKISSGSLSDGSSGSGSGGKGSSKIASKVQYSRIENKKESPFEEDDGDDDDDGQGDNWDDWEGGDMGRLSDEANVTTNAYQSSLYAHPNPFAASMASPPESPELVAQPTPPQFRFAAPPRLAAPMAHHQSPAATPDYLSEIVVSTGTSAAITNSDSQKATSPGSNSSSDSYEVVTDDPILLHSSPFTSSKKSPPKPSEDADKQAENDLFSQFGMVPTFKKSAQPSFLQTPPASSAGAAASSYRQPVVAAAPVSAAAASALFAAEMEDFSVAAASDEWGEDDEWVQGI